LFHQRADGFRGTWMLPRTTKTFLSAMTLMMILRQRSATSFFVRGLLTFLQNSRPSMEKDLSGQPNQHKVVTENDKN
jgi:hypothetical protein